MSDTVKWSTFIFDEEYEVHVVPTNEEGMPLPGHTVCDYCFCCPVVQYSDIEDMIVIVHNNF